MSEPLLFEIVPGERPKFSGGKSDFQWPTWFRPSKSCKTHAHRVRAGRHPMGETLGPEDSRCGDCAHVRVRRYSKTYFKCGKNKFQTGGPCTDIRKKWRGCRLFEEREKECSDEIF